MLFLKDELDFFWITRSIYFPDTLLFFLQKRKLQKLLHYARANTSYYKKVFEGESLELSSFEKLPIVTRQNLREDGFDMVNHHLPKWMYGRSKGGTSGTTGEPVRFYNSAYDTEFPDLQLSYMYFHIFRSIIKAGHSVSEIQNKLRIAEIRRPDILEPTRIEDAEGRHLFIDYANLRSESKEIVEKVIKLEPHIFGCYATSTLEFCHYVEQYGYTGKIKIPYIINSGEALLDGQVQYIERVLGGKVYNRYGTAEFATIGAEEPGSQGLVSCAETFIIEIVDDENKSVQVGQTGRVLVTDLLNYTQPFIRYELGDLAILHEKRGPYIRFSLHGRNRFVMFGEKMLSHFDLNSLFAEHAEAIVQYQIVKKSEHELEVRIVKNNLYFDFMTEDLLSCMKKILGNTINIHMVFLESIPRMGRGKTLVYIDESNQTAVTS